MQSSRGTAPMSSSCRLLGRLIGELDPISPLTLGAIERRVGGRDELLPRSDGGRWNGRDTHARRERNPRALKVETMVGHDRAKPLGELTRLPKIKSPRENREFFPANPREEVFSPNRIHHEERELREEIIAGKVSIRRSEERRVGKECRSRWSSYQ